MKESRNKKLFTDLKNKHDDVKSDVFGSYTGVSDDDEKPIQDVDDL